MNRLCSQLGWWFRLCTALVVIVLAVSFFLYPAVVIFRVVQDPALRETGQSRFVPGWFESAASRYLDWAEDYLRSDYAAHVDHMDVAASEWPMFGSVFFLVTADDLQRQGSLNLRGKVAQAVEQAGAIVTSPASGTWVKTKWGADYLEQENIFYRMLLLMGLSSYERLTGNPQYRQIMSEQRASLAQELLEAPRHLRDDYPGECYPVDVLWAVAAIQRAGRLEGIDHPKLAAELMAAFDGPVKAAEGLPAYLVDSRSGRQYQGARGCGSSGLLIFAPELDRQVAHRWYGAYERGYWQQTGWMTGFREWPRSKHAPFSDVDSGPVLFGIGSVASAFGIGAAKAVGRYDHAAPLTMEAVACSWPTPFGLLVPGLMGQLAADSWSLGEVALLFSMTRPTYVEPTHAFRGKTPRVVWVLAAIYASLGLLFIMMEARQLRRLLGNRPRATPP